MPNPKLDIKFGKRTRSLAKFDATFPHIIFAQLVALGYQPNEAAWVAFYGCNKLTKNDSLVSKSKQYMELEKTQLMIKHFQDEVAANSDGKSSLSLDTIIAQKLEETGEMDKDTTALELLRIANTLHDGKEKADLLMKYADIKGFKKTDEKDSGIRHTMMYLPATCDKCPVLRWVQDNHPDALKSAKPKTDV